MVYNERVVPVAAACLCQKTTSYFFAAFAGAAFAGAAFAVSVLPALSLIKSMK
jgi:hypothetical protein